MKPVYVLGGGLAGTEAALQLSRFGHKVKLIEMRPKRSTEAHKTGNLAELVCSNSFGSLNPISAPGQLKWEAKALGSFILQAAHKAAVPAGQALGMDRELFAKILTEQVQADPNIEIIHESISDLSELPRPAIVATGPLTTPELAQSLQQHFGNEFLYFFDAIAPIIDTESINMDIAWKADRYDKGTADYINCPLNKDEYFNLINAITAAEKITPKDFEKTSFFEGCMPIEVMVDRGPHTLRFGPMKPVGLRNPRTGRDAYATVQLRQDNKEATAYNMVGFQTRMTYSEQARIFRMIPGLEKAEFLKLGSIHRNLYVNSPRCLNSDLSSKQDGELFFAGQITGVEGYFESTCIGLLAALNLHRKITGQTTSLPLRASALGSLLEAITDPSREKNFQPTNINMALLPPLEYKEKDKEKRKSTQILRAQEACQQWLKSVYAQAAAEVSSAGTDTVQL